MINKTFNLILICCLFYSCNSDRKNSTGQLQDVEKSNISDKTPKVTGIGGIFFKAKDPSNLKKWYGENLGLIVDDYGAPFEFRNANRPEEKNYLNWDAFADTTDYFNPSQREFMINYRVQNLEGLVNKLKSNGVEIVDEIATYEYGKFVHIMDIEGNKIELWEPIDSVLETFGRKSNK